MSFPTWLAMTAVPMDGGILSREQVVLAMERVQKIDSELAALAENNYKPLQL